ncbi:putative fermentation associated protein [Lyophyllum shimeji]|uniref:Fermentation associated protein n=1 Tax=Lyophyllum shimeji TaxID=47721 RepID=A0A9P3PKA5_LYOSH|nr:putative fermentation associated protein [Lyophyllum shimeji]
MYWNEEASSIWVEIGSIHFSWIAGRILLKDVSYHSSNQTIRIVKGQVQWRYWIRRPTSEDEIGTIRSGEDERSSNASRCRVQILVHGFEWFLYNRTAAYDNIVSQMEGGNLSRPGSRATERRQSLQKSSRPAVSSPLQPPSSFKDSLRIPHGVWRAIAWIKRQLPNLDPKDLLPLGIEVTKGAIICGNHSTQNLLVAEFHSSEGTFGIVEPRSKLDLYKQLLSLTFQQAVIRYVENENYADRMQSMGELVHGRIIQHSAPNRPSTFLSYRSFAKLWERLGLRPLVEQYISDRRDIHAIRKTRTPRPQKKTHKNLDEATPIGADFAQLEYAIERRLLETPVLELSYYFDVVGQVPEVPDHSGSLGAGSTDIGNGDVAPDWGFDITISGAVIRYGPWADRQRVELQRIFFPSAYRDGEVTPALKPGDKRLWTDLRVFVELRDNTVLHVPFREPSKDWHWDGKLDVPQRQRVREAATIQLTVGDRSSINYCLPMVIGPSGYQPVLEVHLDTIAVTSSLNDIRLVTAESLRVHCELPTPLNWRMTRKWMISVTLRQPVLYLIRDHINMFIDLGKDWATGPPSDYQCFIPMIYALEFGMHHYEVNMYANDHNIIDKPLIREENALFSIRGTNFKVRSDILLDKYRPESTTIPFSIDMPDISVGLSLPRWHTNALHAPKEGNSLANVRLFRIDGSYQYFAEVREEYVEQLKLKFLLHDVAFKNLGWSIRYSMVLRENYLGSFTHFSTLYEYLDRRKRNQPLGDPLFSKYRPGKSNVLQTEMELFVENGTLIMPAGLPGYLSTRVVDHGGVGGIGDCLIFSMPDLQLQFRMHDYYMEMSLNVGAISGGLLPNYPEKVTYTKSALSGMKNVLHIDGLDITANRLFGPQPRTAAYVCIWEIRLGRVKALLSALDGKILAAAGDAFRLNFADIANAPAKQYLPPLDPDVTFVKLSVTSVDVTWQASHAALAITVPGGIRMDSNDLGGRYHRRVTNLNVPDICVKVLLAAPQRADRWFEAMSLTADVCLDIYSAPRGFRDMAQAQAAYVEEQDRMTGRARTMLASLGSCTATQRQRPILHKNGLYLPHPALPTHRDSEAIQSPSQQPRRSAALRKSWANTAHLSDSDAEERISEADRDARLANTRSSTPNPRFTLDDNQGMSSGDESDDEDLTDASSDSDWWDLIDETASDSDPDMSLLRHYSDVTRHYIAPFLETPESWDGCPFVLVRDRALTNALRTHSIGSEAPPQPFQESDPPAAPRDDRDTTTVRFKTRKPVKINITPLVLPAAIHFEEDMRNSHLSPESYIDAMMARHLASMSASRTTISCTLFEVSVPSISISVLQRIAMANGHPTISRDLPETENPSMLDVLAVVQGGLTEISASGVLISDNLTVNAGVNHLSLALDMSVDKKTIKPASAQEFLFSYEADDLSTSVVRNSLDVRWRKSTVHVGHLGPEYIVATGLAMVRCGTELAILSRRRKQQSSSLKQTIVSDVIRYSGEKATVDPLSTIQPSYLVQSGTPHALRTDTTFRFLYHLRNCLWHIEDDRRGPSGPVQDKIKAVDLEDLITMLESRFVAFDPDSYNASHLTALGTLFMMLEINDSSTPSQKPLLSVRSASIHFARFSVVVLDPSNTSPSELLVTDTDVTARMQTGDVLQLPTLPTATMSQTSLKEKRSLDGMKTSALISLGDVTLSVYPHLMGFAQQIMRVRRYYHSIHPATSPPPSLSVHRPSEFFQLLNSHVIFALRSLRIQAAAENLVFEFGLSRVHGASSVVLLPRSHGGRSMNHSILCNEIYIRARSPSDMLRHSDQDILAALEVSAGRINTVSRKEPTSKTRHRLVFAVGSVRFNVPRSALRLYRFIQEWRADFLPGIEETVKALLSELRRAPAKFPSPSGQPTPSRHPSFHVQGQLFHVGISLQVMHGTWLSWEADNIVSYINSSNTPTSRNAFGLQIVSVTLSISSKPNARDTEPSTRVKLVLPPLSATGHYDGTGIHTIALLEFIELKVKPSHWDTLLAVQQKFGQDFHDLVSLIQETNLRQAASATSRQPKNREAALNYSGFLKVRGFRVGLEGPSSTMYLECLDISGGIKKSARLTWNVELSDLAFSLAPRAAARPDNPGFNRNHRSAFVIVDFKVDANNQLLDGITSTVVQILVTKIHAVMQPSSIAELGDFVDHLQAEMLDRKEQRAMELAAFKEKTHSILKTFEVGIRDPRVNSKPWLESYIINVSTRNIGVAFPLTHDQDLQLPRSGSRDSTAVPAFLWSIKSIEFGTHRGETGQAVMKNFSFQFISRFRQSVPSDFCGDNHQTRNKLVYPEMEAQLRSSHSASLRHIWLGANVSGFILDLDSNIPSYIFSLIDVYRQGKDRVEKLSSSLPRAPSGTANDTDVEKQLQTTQRHAASLTSNLFASLTFYSGKVRVYSAAASKLYRTRPLSQKNQEPSDEQVMELGAEVFNLPIVSVWAEYRATPASQVPSAVQEQEQTILMFKSTVHSSQNTLRPTLLPFLTELVNHIETRLRRDSLQSPSPVSTVVTDVSAPVEEQVAFDSVASIRISFSLRIDQSRLELTCLPDVNVVAGLHWENGGFVVNVSPGARKITFTGSVGGLTLGLKHGFLSEDCVKLDARNLAFSVTFAKLEADKGISVGSFSVALDTEFLGVVRFSRLQDILCFKAVWLDRIPIFNSQSATSPKVPSRSPANMPFPSDRRQQFTTVVLLRIRQITLDVDLGQSISATTLDLKNAVMRTKLTEVLSELSVFVEDLTITAKGNVAGHARVPQCVFQTIRSAESSANARRNRMLELSMTSGPLVVSLESDHQKLLHYRAEPLEVKIFDDWPVVGRRDAEKKPLQLSFTVVSPEIVAVVTVGTIPKLLGYVNKFKVNLDAQRSGASRESKTFRVTRTPKPDNPLSAVAEAMLHSARSRFKEAENELSYVIMQHMSLRLDYLRLVVFPRTMDDLEIAQFIGRDVRARLDRLVESGPTAGKRDLILSFSSMTISKFTGLGHPQTSDLTDGREWLASLLNGAPEAIIVGLPSMTMHMISEEKVEDSTTTLVYDFHSKFVRREGDRELKDIYITLNVSLYSWLTILRKNLTREMEQVKASTDWRALLNNTSSQAAAPRKKVPEPLSLTVTSPPSSTAPSPANKPFSPFSPTTALRSSTGGPFGTLSPTSRPTSSRYPLSPEFQDFPSMETPVAKPARNSALLYQPRSRHIERLTMRQLGEATPDVMHPFFTKKAGFNLEDSLPQYVNEYATTPLEEIMEVLLKLYSRQLLSENK